MVSKINSSRSLTKALLYNEWKVENDKAECLWAHNFLKDAHLLSLPEKKLHFERLTSLNERTRTNAVHISLNFDPSELLPNDKLLLIAQSYMQKIGFDRQPYLVYRHYDAGHPHLHIVTTNIQKDGSRISLHGIGRNQSEKARKELEVAFDLVKAEGRKVTRDQSDQTGTAQKAAYGKMETQKAVENILAHVMKQYKCSSLPQLNCILKLYNLVADRGSEQSRTYQHRGLTYRMLSDEGKKVGVPLKASTLLGKPTLTFWEQQFRINQEVKEQHVKRVKTSIDWTLAGKNQSWMQFTGALEKERISNFFVQPTGKQRQDIFYLDHRSGSVFEGTELGGSYTFGALAKRFAVQEQHVGIFTGQKQVEHAEVKQGQAWNNRAAHLTATSDSELTPQHKQMKNNPGFVNSNTF